MQGYGGAGSDSLADDSGYEARHDVVMKIEKAFADLRQGSGLHDIVQRVAFAYSKKSDAGDAGRNWSTACSSVKFYLFQKFSTEIHDKSVEESVKNALAGREGAAESFAREVIDSNAVPLRLALAV